MTVGWYALLVAFVGLTLWFRGGVLGSVIALLFFSMFGGGAALILGGATITPAAFFIVFLFILLLGSMFTRSGRVGLSVRTNVYFLFYTIYGVVGAYILPRAFANTMTVPSLSVLPGIYIFSEVLLQPTIQNITTALYLVGALVASIAAGAAAGDVRSPAMVLRWGIIISWAHVILGVLSVILPQVGAGGVFAVLRNGGYAQVEQLEAGFTRIAGTFPETSAYAGFAFGWFVLMVEFWLRDVASRRTGWTALALGLMILASTASTGYAAMVVYVAVLLLRFLIAGQTLRASKALPIALILFGAVVVILAFFAALPREIEAARRVFDELTFGKSQTLSGRARLFWATSAIKAFQESWGLGIGPGSFRSSSLLLAVLGSTGVVGTVAFLGHISNIIKPLRATTYRLPGDPNQAVAVATAWGAFGFLIPAMISAPTAVPGYPFAVLGGLALAWRWSPPSKFRPSLLRSQAMARAAAGATGEVAR